MPQRSARVSQDGGGRRNIDKSFHNGSFTIESEIEKESSDTGMQKQSLSTMGTSAQLQHFLTGMHGACEGALTGSECTDETSEDSLLGRILLLPWEEKA